MGNPAPPFFSTTLQMFEQQRSQHMTMTLFPLGKTSSIISYASQVGTWKKKDPSHLLPTLVTFMSWNCWFGWVWLDNCSCNDASFCCKGHDWRDIWIGIYKARKKEAEKKKSAMSIVWRTKVPSSPIDTMGKWQKIPFSRETTCLSFPWLARQHKKGSKM